MKFKACSTIATRETQFNKKVTKFRTLKQKKWGGHIKLPTNRPPIQDNSGEAKLNSLQTRHPFKVVVSQKKKIVQRMK